MEKKMVKLKFVKTHSTGSDETAPYDVTLDRECTVKEFIDAVLTMEEWGNIKINNGSRLEYRRDEIISSRMTDKDMASVIDKVRAVGGWSNMNYYLEIKQNKCEENTAQCFDTDFQDYLEEEPNLCEILKGYEGEMIFSLIEGEIKFVGFTEKEIEGSLGLIFKSEDREMTVPFNYLTTPSGIFSIYPSRELFRKYPLDAKKAWAEWKEKIKNYRLFVNMDIKKIGGSVVAGSKYNDVAEFTDESIARQAAREIKKVLEKYREKEAVNKKSDG